MMNPTPTPDCITLADQAAAQVPVGGAWTPRILLDPASVAALTESEAKLPPLVRGAIADRLLFDVGPAKHPPIVELELLQNRERLEFRQEASGAATQQRLWLARRWVRLPIALAAEVYEADLLETARRREVLEREQAEQRIADAAAADKALRDEVAARTKGARERNWSELPAVARQILSAAARVPAGSPARGALVALAEQQVASEKRLHELPDDLQAVAAYLVQIHKAGDNWEQSSAAWRDLRNYQGRQAAQAPSSQAATAASATPARG